MQCFVNFNLLRQIIRIKFTHLQLVATPNADDCDVSSDRLVFQDGKNKPFCVKPYTKEVITKSNQAFLSFYSNSNRDAQGFRAFYTAGAD